MANRLKQAKRNPRSRNASDSPSANDRLPARTTGLIMAIQAFTARALDALKAQAALGLRITRCSSMCVGGSWNPDCVRTVSDAPEIPVKQRDLRKHSDAHRCVAGSR